MMTKRLFLILLVLLVSGCISGGNNPPPVVYVTPCVVIANGITFRTNGTALGTDIVAEPLSRMLTDDITSDRAADLKQYYSVSCNWGSNVGERKDYYYCNGSYYAPEVNDQGVIFRNLWKEFKIGFSVQAYPGDTWTDINGEVHVEQSIFDLTVQTVEAKCTLL
ncbi:MAG: hypothetical protein V1703_00465 [Candidatus Altiarchaeota archaeon]